MTSVLVQAIVKINITNIASTHRLVHIVLKHLAIRLEHFGRLFVERIFGVGFQEQVLQSIHYRVDRQHGLPVLAQNVQANVALQVDVGMVHFRLALDLRRLMRIVGADLKTELELATAIIALVGTDEQLEVEQVIGIGKAGGAGARKIQLVDVFCNSKLCS